MNNKLIASRDKITDSLFNYNLQYFQKEALIAFFKAVTPNCKKMLLTDMPGAGTAHTVATLVTLLLQHGILRKVLILSPRRREITPAADILSARYETAGTLKSYTDQTVLITTYRDLYRYGAVSGFDLVLCLGAHSLHKSKLGNLFAGTPAFILGLTQKRDIKPLGSRFFGDALCVATSVSDLSYGELVEYRFINFIESLFTNMGYTPSATPNETAAFSTDLVLKDTENLLLVETKSYRSPYIATSLVDIAIRQLLHHRENARNAGEYADHHIHIYLVMLCIVEESYKEETLKTHGVIIWDIPNLLYLCAEYPVLTDQLSRISPYPIASIAPQAAFIQPAVPARLVKTDNMASDDPHLKCLNYISALKEIRPGKIHAPLFEKVCTEILCYLFETDFTQISQQHNTNDHIFRMDLLCGLKGTTAFSELLARHYNTKFIVFEYKNYTSKIQQNFIYITEKYLFNAALRNVAVIISRKGFDASAQLAALGCLKENSKLLIDLSVTEIIKMLDMKANGEEPSDYLLSKIEKLLMSVSK